MTETSASDRSDPAAVPLQQAIFNVPNQITIARLALAIVCFVFLGLGWYAAALVLFAIAAGTDWLDGYWARRFNQISQLGRILDPFADKFIICGVFVFLAAIPVSGLAAWVAVVVVSRELLVTGLRSFFEQGGVDFSAKWAGKWKMVAQCAAAILCMYRLTYYDHATAEWSVAPPGWLTTSLIAAVWATVVLTIWSAAEYALVAIQILKRGDLSQR